MALPTRTREHQTNRQRLERELAAHEQQRRPYDSTWRDICDYVLPGASRFCEQGDKRLEIEFDDLKTIDDAGIDANQIQAAGLMNGNTSQTDPWFGFGLEDPDLEADFDVQEWFQKCVAIQSGVYARSNTYQAFFKHFQHLGPFGNSVSALLDDPVARIHNTVFPIGQFYLAADSRDRINTCFRRFTMTVAQVVERFGLDAVSRRVRDLYNRGEYHQAIEIVHVIEPRWLRDIDALDNKSMPFSSVYFERGCHEDRILSESGFRRFPIIAARYDVHPGDVYGFGPGLRALGAIRQLQQQQYDKSVAIDKVVDPALQADAALKNTEIDRNPGGITYNSNSEHPITPLHNVQIDLNHLLLENQDVRQRIHRAFNSDLWAMLARPQGGRDAQKTAREIAAMQTEQLAILAPIKARIDDELLRPHVEATFERLFMQGAFPPPPPQLRGKEMTVRFTGILAMAQQLAGITNANQFIGFAGTLLSMGFEDVRDRIDIDGVIDIYAKRYDVPTRMIVPVSRAQPIREARNRALAAQQQSEQLPQLAKGAKDLASAAGNTGAA